MYSRDLVYWIRKKIFAYVDRPYFSVLLKEYTSKPKLVKILSNIAYCEDISKRILLLLHLEIFECYVQFFTRSLLHSKIILIRLLNN